jgi:hypothetical protein
LFSISEQWMGASGRRRHKIEIKMNFYWLLLGTLAVWRLTHLVSAEDGPWNLIFRLRKLAGDGFWGGLMDCFYCLSLWFAAPVAYWIGRSWLERIFLWPALSAGAILLERLIRVRPENTETELTESEIQETENVLRQEPKSTAHAGPIAINGFSGSTRQSQSGTAG